MVTTTKEKPVVKTAEPAKKAERKKPVRKAPVQKDYPSKMAWLQAMLEYETRQSEVTAEAKVKRLDKRITAKQDSIATATAELNKLVAQRVALKPYKEEEEDEGYDDFEIANGRDEAAEPEAGLPQS